MKHCVSFWIYYLRNDLCTFLAWPSRKSASKWMLLPHRYLDEMGHTSHSSSKGIISAMLQEAESPPTFSKTSETMFTPLCTLHEEYTLTESISKTDCHSNTLRRRRRARTTVKMSASESCIRLQKNVKNKSRL